MCMSYTDVAQVANAARNYEILYERDDDDAERLDKRRGGGDNHRSNNNYSGNNRNSGNGRDKRNRGHQSNRSANSGNSSQKSGDRHQPTTQQSSHRNHSHNNDRHGSDRETRVSSPTDLLILVFSSPGVPLRATPTRSALRVDLDTQESDVELLVSASSVVKLAICRRIARRTPL
nr:hypothetical protein [Tanacetum cinerariifolium]